VHTDRGALGAGTIVLAAGAYGTPGILLRSGIGPGLAHDLPVGEGLADHVGVALAWEPTTALAADEAGLIARVTVRRGDLVLVPVLQDGEPGALAFR
jgi:choline dehydrogenase-like flavoprotein